MNKLTNKVQVDDPISNFDPLSLHIRINRAYIGLGPAYGIKPHDSTELDINTAVDYIKKCRGYNPVINAAKYSENGNVEIIFDVDTDTDLGSISEVYEGYWDCVSDGEL